MPELIEVEYYRRLAEVALHRPVVNVDTSDAWFLKGGTSAGTLTAALVGRAAQHTRRRGKLLLLDFAGDSPGTVGPVLGLRFGMTGRLLVDGRYGIEHLEYGSSHDEPAWDRFTMQFSDGGELRLRDPRRLGGVQLDPPEDRLGVDALTVGPAALRAVLAGSTTPLKVRLMDQARLAGIGNLIADETLSHAGLDPARPAGSLAPAEVRRMQRHLRGTLLDLLERGGSHTGDLHRERRHGGVCPRDGAPLLRRSIGGRTTYSCPVHQH